MEETRKLEIMYSEKGKKLVLYLGYKFYKAYEGVLGGLWRCVKKGCPAKLTIDESISTILKGNATHNHEKCQNLKREKFSNSLKTKASHYLSGEPRRVILKEMQEAGIFSDNFTAKDIKRLSLNLYRARRKNLPRLPKSQQDVHETLNQTNAKSNKEESIK